MVLFSNLDGPISRYFPHFSRNASIYGRTTAALTLGVFPTGDLSPSSAQDTSGTGLKVRSEN